MANKNNNYFFSILSFDKSSTIEKAKELVALSNEDYIVDLRIDRLINNKFTIDEICEIIEEVKTITNKEVRARLMTLDVGGDCYLDDKKYLEIVKELFEKGVCEYISLESNRKSSHFKDLNTTKTKLILTTYVDDKESVADDVKSYVKNADVAEKIELVLRVFNSESLENLQNEVKVAKEKEGKELLFVPVTDLCPLKKKEYDINENNLVYLNNYKECRELSYKDMVSTFNKINSDI